MSQYLLTAGKSAAQEPLFHRRLVESTDALRPVPGNTSHNIRGKSIVCTPGDAIKCFLGSDLRVERSPRAPDWLKWALRDALAVALDVAPVPWKPSPCRPRSSISVDLPMRIMLGRGDWRPGFRIESLRRYAFIGDSHAYGFGVAPDQTLPANAERQMNELWPAWPVEAVNLGVSGYNLWNSWLTFKHGPQVYDGVVLALCANDADLFNRSFYVIYPEPQETRWESANPVGAAVALYFDEIASFSQERSLPVAVIYYNADGVLGQLRIGEIIGDLCAARGLPFIDTFAHYRDRHFKRDDLFVSSEDTHPSAMAHEAVGRHLAATLKRHGWFGASDASTTSAAPDRILASARAMVEADHYPPDAALNWALGALDAKSRVARRMQAAGAADDFSAAAARVAEALTVASRRWHTANRTRAFVGDLATGRRDIAWGLLCSQEERLKVEELGVALGMGDWNRLAAGLLEVKAPPQLVLDTCPSDVAAFLEGCSLDLSQIRDSLEGLCRLAAPAAVGSRHDEALMLADLETLARLVDLAQQECAALKASFLRIESVFSEARPALSKVEIAQVACLIGASFKRVKEGLDFVPRWRATIKGIHDADNASFTTVEVTISAKAIQGGQIYHLVGLVDYSVPNRLPCRDQGCFWADGSTRLVKLHFPILYAGRLGLRTFNPKTVNAPTVEGTIVKVELYNGKNQRGSIDPASFYRDRNSRFVSSPLVYLR